MGGYELEAGDLEDWMRAAPHDAQVAMLEWVTVARVDPRAAARDVYEQGPGQLLLTGYVEGADALVSYAVAGRVIRIAAVISAH